MLLPSFIIIKKPSFVNSTQVNANYNSYSRALQRTADYHMQAESPETCQTKNLLFCSITVTCVLSCEDCGWKTVEDNQFFVCVKPSSDSCATVSK